MDDLVASLRLTLQNELAAGIDEAKGDFEALTGDVNALRGSLGEVDEAMAALALPPGFGDGFAGVTEGLTALNSETAELLDAWQQIGVQIDDDTASLRNMSSEMDGVLAQMADAQARMPGLGSGGGGGGGGGGDVPPVIPPAPNNPPNPNNPPEDDDKPKPPGDGHAGDAMSHVLMTAVAASVAEEAAKKYAEFDQILYQTAIKEGFTSDNAGGEVARLTDVLDKLAVQTGNSSEDLAKANYFLVTTGMSPQLIGQMMPSLAQDATAYGNDPMEDAQSVFTLNGVMNIPPDQMSRGLSVLSEAAQLGHFGVGDFGNYLPGLAAQLSILKDTGIGGEVQVAAALEATRRVSGTSEQDAIDMQDLITYLASPTASRFFDRTKRSQDLMGAPILDLFKKYHIDGINIPQYLDDREATGEGSFDAMMDLSHLIETKLPANVSGSDEREIFGALFHNQQAATAALGIAENWDVYQQDKATLYGVGDGKVQTDFQTSINSPQGQLSVTNEKFSEMNREMGSNLIPSLTLLGDAANTALTGLNTIADWYKRGFSDPVGTAIGTGAAYADHYVPVHPGRYSPRLFNNPDALLPQPIILNVKVDKTGNVTAEPAPGVNAQVNQGTMLGAH